MSDERGTHLDRMKKLTGDHMVDLAYTYKTFFKMSRWATKGSYVMDLLMVCGTGMLTVSLVWTALPDTFNIGLAILTAILSFLGLFLDLDGKAATYESTGDAYNTLFKECREFYLMVLLNEDLPLEEKQRKLEELTKRHRELNELTPATWDLAYAALDEDDVLGNIEVTQEEKGRLFGDLDTGSMESPA